MSAARKKVLILGATGSVGSSTVEIILANASYFHGHTLVALGNDLDKLAAQAVKLCAVNVVVYDTRYIYRLRSLLLGTNIHVFGGSEALRDILRVGFDIVVAAISGIAGLIPLLWAIPYSKVVAIANKESIVCAQHFLFQYAKRHNTLIVPIDSEHSAIFRLMHHHCPNMILDITKWRDSREPSFIHLAEHHDNAEQQNKSGCSNYIERHQLEDHGVCCGKTHSWERVILTASGGPFRGRTLDQMEYVTPQQACKHPTWVMGRKISVDSATLMNKGLEVVEASQLFNISVEDIDVVIHPESIVHGMIKNADGSLVAHCSAHDMKVAISFALFYPYGEKGTVSANQHDSNKSPLDITQYNSLTFFKPDLVNFPALSVAYEAARCGQAAVIAMNAANECAVTAFLDEKIKFTKIATIVKNTISTFASNTVYSIDDVLDLHNEVEKYVQQKI